MAGENKFKERLMQNVQQVGRQKLLNSINYQSTTRLAEETMFSDMKQLTGISQKNKNEAEDNYWMGSIRSLEDDTALKFNQDIYEARFR